MFQIGLFEIVILILAVILFINPKDLPAFIYKVGQLYGNVQRQIRQIQGKYHRFEASMRSRELQNEEQELNKHKSMDSVANSEDITAEDSSNKGSKSD